MRNHFKAYAFIFLSCFLGHSFAQQHISVNQGHLERYSSFSSQFISPRNIDVWLPSNYNFTQKYGVVYFHDGQMLFDSNTTWNHQEWGIDETLNQFNQSAKVPYIAVAIWNDEKNRHSNYFPQKVYDQLKAKEKKRIFRAKRANQSDVFSSPINSDDYLKFIVYEVKPFIDSVYSTFPDLQHTAIAGSSMGGLISMYAICEYPEVFGTAACLSTHWPGIFEMKNNPVPKSFVQYFQSHLPNPNSHKFLFTHGTVGLDSLYGPTQQRIDQVLLDGGYSHFLQNTSCNWKTQVDQGLGHQESTWRKQFEDNANFLLTQ